MRFYGDLMGFNGIYMDLPSGNLLHSYRKSPVFLWENDHYFDWVIFSSYVELPEGRVHENGFLKMGDPQGSRWVSLSHGPIVG